MTDLSLRNFQNLQNGRRKNQLDIDVVLRPYLPVMQLKPVLEALTSPGVDGYRARLVHRQPRQMRVFGLIGASSVREARAFAQELQNLEGSYGDAVFTQNSTTVTLKKCQMTDIEAQPVNATLGTATTEYSNTCEFTATFTFTDAAATRQDV